MIVVGSGVVPARFAPLSLGAIVPQGWILAQMEQDLTVGFAGCLDELTYRASSRIYVNRVESFETTPAGMVQDTPRTWWNGETEAVWLDGLVRMAYLTRQSRAMAKVDRLMDYILNSQDDDGYIGIYTPRSRYQHPKENGEFWTQSRIFLAMLVYYSCTGKVQYLRAVERAVHLTMQHYGPHRSYFNNREPAGGTGHGLMLVEAMAWLYWLTGKDIYRQYGIWCYKDYCSSDRIRDKDNQVQHLLDMNKGFYWHTPHVTEHLRVPLWVYHMTNDPVYRQASENAFAKVARYLVPSGACIGSENIEDRTPTADTPYEYCAITELLVSYQWALQMTGDLRYADSIETLVFNAAQGARLPDGTAIAYLSTDNRYTATRDGGFKYRLKYSPTHEDVAVCCSPNAVKLMPYYVAGMWLACPDGLVAATYGPSKVEGQIKGVTVEIETVTDYPFSDKIMFRVMPDQPVEFVLYFRVPRWAVEARVHCPGASIREDAGVIEVKKEWQRGDELILTFVFPLETCTAADGEIYIRRGPLVYALSIPEKQIITKTYKVPPFVDLDFVPEDEGQMLEELSLDPRLVGFVRETNPKADLLFPWHEPPVFLTGSVIDETGQSQMVRFVPMGTTVLRRVTFNRRR